MAENAREVLAICWLAHDNDWTVAETRQWMVDFDIANDEEFMGHANRGAKQISDALAVAGFVVVPVEPTQEMLNAGSRAATDSISGADAAWEAMLAAAPKP